MELLLPNKINLISINAGVGVAFIFLLIGFLLFGLWCQKYLQLETQKIKKEREYYKKKAELDAMCGIYNKIVLETLIKEQLQKKGVRLRAVMILDIDELKNINDQYGHIQGDLAIIMIADLLKKYFDKSELLGRIGGDEFMVFFRDLKSKGLLEKRIEEFLGQTRTVFIGEQQTIPVRCSIGITFVTEGRDFEQLYSEADCALYYVKNHTKNGYAVYDNFMWRAGKDNL